MSFIIRKRQQIDSLNELGKDKRPPESMIWDSEPEALEEWLDNIFDTKGKKQNEFELKIKPSDIEG